ncbi:MAG: pitrilysin family protein [Rickettsiales bacterium]
MRANIRILFLLIGVLVWGSAAQAARIEEIKTDGGITAWMSEDKTLPIFSLRLSFEHGGTAYDPAGKQGLAVFATNAMTEGAGDLDSKAFHEALEEKAISIDVGVNEDRITVSLDSLSEHADDAFALLAKVLKQPRFEKDDVERVRTELLTALNQLQEDPNYAASRAFSETAYKGHPYSQPAYGTPESLATITVDDLKAFHQKHFTKTGLMLSISGDLSKEQVKTLLSKTLDDLPKGEAIAALPSVDIQEYGTKVINRDVPQTVVGFALPGVTRDDPMFYAAYLMNYSLGGSTLTARLGEDIRRKHGLSYYVNTYLDVNDASHILKGGMAVRNDKVKEAIDLLKKNINSIPDHPFSQEELDSAKDYVIGSFPLSLDTNREFASYMQMMQWYKLGIDYIDKRSDHFRSVTLQQVNDAAKRLLNTKNLLIVAVGGEDKNEKQSQNSNH